MFCISWCADFEFRVTHRYRAATLAEPRTTSQARGLLLLAVAMAKAGDLPGALEAARLVKCGAVTDEPGLAAEAVRLFEEAAKRREAGRRENPGWRSCLCGRVHS